jgi:polyvinyl alcohol dehydrogenase (cytochrome)
VVAGQAASATPPIGQPAPGGIGIPSVGAAGASAAVPPQTPTAGGSPASGGVGGMAAPPVGSVPNSSDGDVGHWIGFGGGYAQTFASTDSTIELSNLSSIGSAWNNEAPGGVTGTPAIFGGVVYWTDWVGNVHADRITDGSPVWTKTYERGFTSSPFVTQDKVYLSNRDNMVYALDRASGVEVWATAVSTSELAQLWSSPMVADGVVIVGIGGKGTSDGGLPYTSTMLMNFRGGVVGLDAMTGKVRWHFENTIGADGTMYGPGVSSWSTAAIDTVRKIAYIGSGNSYYSPASPYSDSLLALDYMTTEPKGRLVWHKQFTEDDNFTSGSPYGPDYDVGATPNLFTLDGKDYVSVGDKGGRFYILERDQGALLHTIPIGRGSSTGGVMAPAAYADGKLYVTANSTGTTEVMRVDAPTGEVDWSITVSSGVSFGAPLLLKDVLLVGTTQSFPSGSARAGTIVALDIQTGEQVRDWSLTIPNQRGGGMSVYQNTLFLPYGFVFESTSAERSLTGGLLAAALGGKVIDTPVGGPVATYSPTYTAIYDEILTQQGCTAERCHGGLGLKLLSKDGGYTSLLNDVGTGACAGMKFIVAGQPDQSLLYRKLADEMPACGARMPLSLPALKPEELTQVRTWIELGAAND